MRPSAPIGFRSSAWTSSPTHCRTRTSVSCGRSCNICPTTRFAGSCEARAVQMGVHHGASPIARAPQPAEPGQAARQRHPTAPFLRGLSRSTPFQHSTGSPGAAAGSAWPRVPGGTGSRRDQDIPAAVNLDYPGALRLAGPGPRGALAAMPWQPLPGVAISSEILVDRLAFEPVKQRRKPAFELENEPVLEYCEVPWAGKFASRSPCPW